MHSKPGSCGHPKAALPADRMAQSQLTRPLAVLDSPRAPEDRPGGWAGRDDKNHHVLL